MSKTHFLKKLSIYCPLFGVLLVASAFANPGATTTNPSITPDVVTAMNVNQQTDHYVGKQISLNGDIDRVLGPGAYIVTDRGTVSGPNHKVLVLTQGSGFAPGGAGQPAIAGQVFREGDQVKIQGKVEQLVMNAETDTFSPKSDQETIQDTGTSMPVIVLTKSGAIQKQY
jgi:hypothetical protein